MAFLVTMVASSKLRFLTIPFIETKFLAWCWMLLKWVGSVGFLSFSHWYNMIKHVSCLNYNFASRLKKLVGTSKWWNWLHHNVIFWWDSIQHDVDQVFIEDVVILVTKIVDDKCHFFKMISSILLLLWVGYYWDLSLMSILSLDTWCHITFQVFPTLHNGLVKSIMWWKTKSFIETNTIHNC